MIKNVIYLVIMLMFLQINYCYAQTIYVSPNGNDDDNGLSSSSPLKQISTAVSRATSGTQILLLPGTYDQLTQIDNVNGEVDKPVNIKSYSTNPDSFAIINRYAEPSASSDKNAFRIDNSSWIEIENIKFRNCWTDIIVITNSSYISIIGCEFIGGKRAIKPSGKGCHHFLVENCYWKQHEDVWASYDWEEMHHGSQSYYNGSLFHPDNTDGCYVIRNNIVKNVFNAFRTAFESQLDRDANGEFYNNVVENSRDNAFEPEGSAFNLYFYNNYIHNSHKPFSIDGLKGGPLYIFGNIITQDSNSYTKSLTTGIWKYKNGPLTEPCYVFNNSFYTRAKAFKEGEATNQQMKHFNNVYYFFEGSNRLRLSDWHNSFEFDYDCINQDWPSSITNNNQEQKGIIADAKFIDGPGKNLKLQNNSPCIDAGKIMNITELGWTQSFVGNAPDIGAYDNNEPVDGPPFRYFEPPGWSKTFDEMPRIVRHMVNNDLLILHFSYPIAPSTLSTDAIKLFEVNTQVEVISAEFSDDDYTLKIKTNKEINNEMLKLSFEPKPIGANGKHITYWASTIGMKDNMHITEVTEDVHNNTIEKPNTITAYPNPFNSQAKIIVNLSNTINAYKDSPLLLYDIKGELQDTYTGAVNSNSLVFNIRSDNLATGIYFAVFKMNKNNLTQKILVLK